MKFEDVENARIAYHAKKTKILKRTIGIVLIVAALFLTVIFVAGGHNSIDLLSVIHVLIFFVFFVVVVGFSLPNLLTKKELANYKKNYKAYFVEKQLASFLNNIEYKHDSGLDRNILRETGMINTGDVFSSNDLVTGIYKGVKFMQADVHIQVERTDDDGNKYYVTIFKGRWMVFEFPKKFNFRMVLSHKKIPTYYKNPRTGKTLEVMKTESDSFNERFVVQAEDEFEAFYILDPVFIENMEMLGEQHNDKVSVYFCNNKMLVGVNDGNDIFEPPNPKFEINENAEFKKIASEMQVITGIVDNLKLSR